MDKHIEIIKEWRVAHLNHFYVQHFHRGCPIFAFFARAGVDDACAIGFVT